MNLRHSALLLAGFGALALASVPAHAASISLFNTGMGAEGSVESHYTLLGGSPVTTLPYVVETDGFPIPPWLANNSTSKWIAPQANYKTAPHSDPDGVYTYETTFDLTGLQASTAQITGGWSTDNNGLNILINGQSLGYTTNREQFAIGFSSFAINSGFVAGVNTIDFVVRNEVQTDGNPTGLRVEMSGTADPIPEPAFFQMGGLLAGGGLLALRSRRSKRA